MAHRLAEVGEAMLEFRSSCFCLFSEIRFTRILLLTCMIVKVEESK